MFTPFRSAHHPDFWLVNNKYMCKTIGCGHSYFEHIYAPVPVKGCCATGCKCDGFRFTKVAPPVVNIQGFNYRMLLSIKAMPKNLRRSIDYQHKYYIKHIYKYKLIYENKKKNREQCHTRI